VNGRIIRPLSHHLPAGSLRTERFALDLDPDRAGWAYSSLRIVELAADEALTVDTGPDEMLVLPLSGACAVTSEGVTFELAGRDHVFHRVTDFAYLPRDSTASISSSAGGRFALPGARARRRLPFRYGPAEDVPVELRGAGACSRQVVNFCTPEVFEADNLISVEVYTPAGNWSSYPPHKHDEMKDDETELEEIYYFEVGEGPSSPGIAYQRVYGTHERPIDLLAEVRSGDVVTIPHGWHGPSMAVPGYDLYYLNVMAGPGPERAWRICDDPAHTWVRDTWAHQAVDPRLPLTTGSEENAR
jgi:5-deoxy-glucuronate isomerase